MLCCKIPAFLCWVCSGDSSTISTSLIHSVVLLYQTCRRSETTEFHVYVIPNDSSVRQVGDNRPAERIVIFYRLNKAENVADGYLKNCRLGVLLRIRLNNLGYLWGACVCQFCLTPGLHGGGLQVKAGKTDPLLPLRSATPAHFPVLKFGHSGPDQRRN